MPRHNQTTQEKNYSSTYQTDGDTRDETYKLTLKIYWYIYMTISITSSVSNMPDPLKPVPLLIKHDLIVFTHPEKGFARITSISTKY